MKILWVCNIMLPKISQKMLRSANHGGGWLIGLSDDLLKQENIKLTVCFPLEKEEKVIEGHIDNLQYFGFPQNQQDPTKYNFNIEKHIEYILKKVNPDIIHIFGTEYPHTLAIVNVCEKLCIIDKVVINIQGLTSILGKHYYASLPKNVINRYTLRDLLKNDSIRNQRRKFDKRGKFEVRALKKVKHVIGRTDWDKASTCQINPELTYHFCNETLRSTFYQHAWDMRKCKKHSIFISQCSYPIKGFHLMLQAMPEILKRYPDAHIYTTGSNPLKLKTFIEKMKISSYQKYIGEVIKKLGLENNVTFLGNLNENQMCEMFLKSHVFVSPSVVENESNSISEAKILGVPVVASYVGGVTNRINKDVDGFLYQHDALYMLAHYVCEIFGNENLALKFSENAKKNANEVHNRKKNLNTMIRIYEEILDYEK